MLRSRDRPPVYFESLLNLILDSKVDLPALVSPLEFQKAAHRSLKLLVQNLKLLSPGSLHRLASFYSLYIVNFKLEFDTELFLEADSDPEESPRKHFCREVLVKTQNLHQDLTDIIDCNYQMNSIIPPLADPVNAFSGSPVSELAHFYRQAEETLTKPRKMGSSGPLDGPEELKEEEIIEEVALEMRGVAQAMKVAGIEIKQLSEIILTALMEASRKTITHWTTRFGRVKSFLKDLFTSEELRTNALDCIYAFWIKSSFHVKLVMQNLVREEIVGPGTLLEWSTLKIKGNRALAGHSLLRDLFLVGVAGVLRKVCAEDFEQLLGRGGGNRRHFRASD